MAAMIAGSLLAAAAPAQAIDFAAPVAYPTGSWPESLAMADVAGDAEQELLLTTSLYFDKPNDAKLIVYELGPKGVTELARRDTHQTLSGSAPLAVGDFDGDGDRDVAVGLPFGIDVFERSATGLGAAVYVTGTPERPGRMVAAQLDGDAADELLIANRTDIARGDRGPGGWTWTDVPTTTGALDLAVADLNGDERADLMSVGQHLRLHLQGEDGTFGQTVLHPDVSGSGVGVGEVTGDGVRDVVVTAGGNAPASKVLVYRGGAAGPWPTPDVHPVHDIPQPVVVSDVDGDGRDDVTTVHGGWHAFGVLLQEEKGALLPEQRWGLPYASSYNPDGVVVTDADGDGRRDVIVADYNHGLLIARQLAPVAPKPDAPGTPAEPASTPARPHEPAPTTAVSPTTTEPPQIVGARPMSGMRIHLRCVVRCRVKASGSLRRGSRLVAHLKPFSRTIGGGGRETVKLRTLLPLKRRGGLRLQLKIVARDDYGRVQQLVLRDKVKLP